jgi:plastocyanin
VLVVGHATIIGDHGRGKEANRPGLFPGKLAFTKKTLSAKAGTVKIAFTNDASFAHNFTLQKGTNGAQVGATPTFSRGE